VELLQNIEATQVLPLEESNTMPNNKHA